MKFIVFEYRDELCFDGKFRRQACVVPSVEACIKLYALNECEYKIVSVEDVKDVLHN